MESLSSLCLNEKHLYTTCDEMHCKRKQVHKWSCWLWCSDASKVSEWVVGRVLLQLYSDDLVKLLRAMTSVQILTMQMEIIVQIRCHYE